MRLPRYQDWDQLLQTIQQRAESFGHHQPISAYLLNLIPIVEALQRRDFFSRLVPYLHHGMLDFVTPRWHPFERLANILWAPGTDIRIGGMANLNSMHYVVRDFHWFTDIHKSVDYLEETLTLYYRDDPLFWNLTINIEPPNSPNSRLVARWNDTIIGHTAIQHQSEEDCWKIQHFFIEPEYQSTQIPLALLTYLERFVHCQYHTSNIIRLVAKDLSPDLVHFFQQPNLELALPDRGI